MGLADDIIDRQKLRRKLGFWRVAAIAAIIVMVLGIAVVGRFGNEQLSGKAGDHIAHVAIAGTITGSAELLDRLDRIAEADRVKGLVLTVSSPGGTTSGGEAIYEAVRRIADKKPVVAQVDGMAASAGYMVAAASDQIVARQTSIVGSIGVIFQYPNIDGLLDNLGVDMRAIRSTPLKAEPNFFGDTPPEAEAMIQAMITDSFDWFKALVAERREFDDATINRLADGSVFTGRQGIENGLVDALGGFGEAERWLRSQEGVGDTIPIVKWEPPREPVGLFFSHQIVRLIGQAFSPIPSGEVLPERLTDRLFLDGLLSVWHASADQGANTE